MPLRSSSSRRGMIFSSGRSICCSTFRSAIPSMSLHAFFIWLPMVNILLRSEPKSFMAMLACVPESMASIRWNMGWPISMFAPASTERRRRTSLSTSSWLRLSSWNGASISLTFTPKACSSSSARPVFLATVFISGTCSRSLSALAPMESLSSSEIPGSEEMLMVKEPSLNLGRKLLPSVRNTARAMTNRAAAEIITGRVWSSTQSSAVW